MSGGDIFMIGIMVAMVGFSSAMLGAILGSYTALYVVSKKLTGTRWTFWDILGVFDKEPTK